MAPQQTPSKQSTVQISGYLLRGTGQEGAGQRSPRSFPDLLLLSLSACYARQESGKILVSLTTSCNYLPVISIQKEDEIPYFQQKKKLCQFHLGHTDRWLVKINRDTRKTPPSVPVSSSQAALGPLSGLGEQRSEGWGACQELFPGAHRLDTFLPPQESSVSSQKYREPLRIPTSWRPGHG